MTAADWLDESTLRLVAAHRTWWANDVALGVMRAGTNLAVLADIGFAALVVAAIRCAYRPAGAILLSAAASVAATTLLKHVFHRPRPPAELSLVHVSGYAMPSTHAALTMAAAVAWLVAGGGVSRGSRAAGVDPLTHDGGERVLRDRVVGGVPVPTVVTAAVALAVMLVGACLVYLGAHWVTDVLAGWALGGLVGWGAGRVFRPRTRSAASTSVA